MPEVVHPHPQAPNTNDSRHSHHEDGDVKSRTELVNNDSLHGKKSYNSKRNKKKPLAFYKFTSSQTGDLPV